MMRGTCGLLLACLSLGHPLVRAATIEQLTRTPMITHIEISPDGRHLAARMLVDGLHSLVFLNRETMQVIGGLRLGGRNEVGTFQWANNERVVANAGIYDLPLLYKQGDIRTWFAGAAYLEAEVGRDPAGLERYSPVHAVRRVVRAKCHPP